MDSLVLLIATLGLGLGIASLVCCVRTSKKLVHKSELREIQKKLTKLEARIDHLYAKL